MTQRAFALAELVSIAAILLLLAAVLILSSGDSRRRARLAGSIANLQEYAVGTQAYAADSLDRVWTFSWRAGVDYGFGGIATTDNQAAANQATYILRTRGGLTGLQPITGWFPYLLYSHLVLAEFLDQPLPSKTAVSPGDLPRLAWQSGFDQFPPSTTRLRFSSSYEEGPSFYSPDALINGVPTVQQDPLGHRFFQIGDQNTRMGRRRLSEVMFPSQKAMLYEQNQRFFGERQPYFMYDEARIPIMSADGSVSVRSELQANLGFQPNNPLSTLPTRVNYVPELNWETPPLNGHVQELVYGRIRWTRSGMRGRDFGGPEVPWSPP